MNKKLVALCLCVAILAGALTAGTLAYFTDKEQVKNTMTVGNVAINIEEYQKNAQGTYEAFENNDFNLYPLNNGQGIYLRNKVVYTYNTSPSKDDAYIRTIVLFEANDLLPDNYANEGGCCFKGIHYNQFNDNNEVQESGITGKQIHSSVYTELKDTVTINGEKYWVAVLEEANYNPIAWDEALYSISGVYLDKNLTSEQIAGWGNDGVDVLVFSQGIQTEGFELGASGSTYKTQKEAHDAAMKALGEVNQENLTKWIELNEVEEGKFEVKTDAVINDYAAIK